MTTRMKWTSNLMGTMGKSLRRKGKGLQAVDEDTILMKGDEDHILSRMRVILTHLQENATADDILFVSSGNVAPDAKEAVNAIVEAVVLDDTMGLIKALQTYSCSTLAFVVKLTFMSMKEPLLPCKMVGYMLAIFEKYAPFLEEKNLEKIEEIGSTLERYSSKGETLDILQTLCQCLKIIPLPNDEQAYAFAPLILLPKLWMLNDTQATKQDSDLYFNLLSNADEVIEVMEFLIEHSDILFDGRARRAALLKKGFKSKVELRKTPPKGEPINLEIEHTNNEENKLDTPIDDADSILDDDDEDPFPIPLLDTKVIVDENPDMLDEIRSFSDKTPVCTATVVFDYDPVEDGEIQLRCGQIIQVFEIEEDGWWYGRHSESSEVGIFPGVYVKRDEPNSNSISSLIEKCHRYETAMAKIRADLELRVGHSSMQNDCDAIEELMGKITSQCVLNV